MKHGMTKFMLQVEHETKHRLLMVGVLPKIPPYNPKAFPPRGLTNPLFTGTHFNFDGVTISCNEHTTVTEVKSE